MWRVDDCSAHGYVVYYWISRLDMSIISLRMCLFSKVFYCFLPRFVTFFVEFDLPCLWKISFSSEMILEP